MLFSTTKAGHIGQILSTAFFGQVLTSSLTPPDPGQIETYGHLLIQVVVAAVTVWATIRKALQKPEAVVKVPAATVAVAVPGQAVSPTLPTSPAPTDGTVE